MAFVVAMRRTTPRDSDLFSIISKSITPSIVDDTSNYTVVKQYLDHLQEAPIDAACQEVCRLSSLVKSILRLHPRDVNMHQTLVDIADSLSVPIYYASFLYAAWTIVQKRVGFLAAEAVPSTHYQVLGAQIADCVGKNGPLREFAQVVEGFAAGRCNPVMQMFVTRVLTNVRNNVFVSTANATPSLEFSMLDFEFETAVTSPGMPSAPCKPVFFSPHFIQDIRTGLNALHFAVAQCDQPSPLFTLGEQLSALDAQCEQSLVWDTQCDEPLMATSEIRSGHPSMEDVARALSEMPDVSEAHPVEPSRIRQVTLNAEATVRAPNPTRSFKSKIGHISEKVSQLYVDAATHQEIEEQLNLFAVHNRREILVVLDSVGKDNIRELAAKVNVLEKLLEQEHPCVHSARNKVRKWCRDSRNEINKLHRLQKF